MALKFTTSYIEDSLDLLRNYKATAERAMAQVTDQQLFTTLDDESNSIAIVVKHIAGNMRSRVDRFPDLRWREAQPQSGQRICRSAEYPRRFAAVVGGGMETPVRQPGPLRRGPGRTVPSAGSAFRDAGAYPADGALRQSIGQIVMLAKHFAHAQWKPLTVPRNRSQEFNRQVATGESSQR